MFLFYIDIFLENENLINESNKIFQDPLFQIILIYECYVYLFCHYNKLIILLHHFYLDFLLLWKKWAMLEHSAVLRNDK